MLSIIYMYRIYSSKLCKFSQIDLLKMYATFWGGVEELREAHFVRSMYSSESSALSRQVILLLRNNATWLVPSISYCSCSLIPGLRKYKDVKQTDGVWCISFG